MSKKEKLVKRLKSKPKDFTWDELTILLYGLGFEELSTGTTGGSRRKFYHKANNRIINLHKPHPQPILKKYALEQVIEILTQEGLI